MSHACLSLCANVSCLDVLRLTDEARSLLGLIGLVTDRPHMTLLFCAMLLLLLAVLAVLLGLDTEGTFQVRPLPRPLMRSGSIGA